MHEAPKRVEIAPFPGGKRLAVTLSYDDGRVHDRRLVRALNEWGLKGTFNLNSALLTRTGRPAPEAFRAYLDACEVAALYQGHEVAIHTATHPYLDRLEPSQIASEVLEDRKALEDLVGYPVRGMAYPFGTYNARVVAVLRELGIVYSRTVESRERCFPPAEPLAWAATMHQYNEHPSPLPQRWESFYESRRSCGQVFFVWGHSYEFPDRGDWAGLERLLKPLAGRSDVWYCTNVELFDYEAARTRLAVAANRRTAYNPSGIPVTLLVDGKPVDVPPGQVIGLAG